MLKFISDAETLRSDATAFSDGRYIFVERNEKSPAHDAQKTMYRRKDGEKTEYAGSS